MRAIITITAVCVAGLVACGGNASPPAAAAAPAPAPVPGAPEIADLAVRIQATDNEAGVGIVVRLDSRYLSRRWRADIPGFNVGFALRDGHYLYVSCIGFVGKLDMKSGKYVWRH